MAWISDFKGKYFVDSGFNHVLASAAVSVSFEGKGTKNLYYRFRVAKLVFLVHFPHCMNFSPNLKNYRMAKFWIIQTSTKLYTLIVPTRNIAYFCMSTLAWKLSAFIAGEGKTFLNAYFSYECRAKPYISKFPAKETFSVQSSPFIYLKMRLGFLYLLYYIRNS